VYFNFISNAIRPDIVVDFKGSVYVVELTVPYETNCTKAKRRKKERYRHLRSELITTCHAFEVQLNLY
jgi:hypothetical protein